MKCNSLSCFSIAVARSKGSGLPLCSTCAMKISAMFGCDSIETLPGGKFPWEYPGKPCPHCGIMINQYQISLTGDCPSCKKPVVIDDYPL